MKLTKNEMDLENLEYSFGYSAAMIGEVVIFQLNSNINDEQRESLTKEIICRCNSQPDLLKACEKTLSCLLAAKAYPETMNLWNDEIAEAEAAIAKGKKE